jgi:beta-1,4-mannosyltransferase
MKNKKVLFVPYWADANPYQQLLKAACEKHGCIVVTDLFPKGFLPFYKLSKQHVGLDVMHVHWISELIMRTVWSKHPLLFFLKYCLFGLDCWIVKIKGIRLIWTIHNKVSHESKQLHIKRELKLRRLLSRQAHKVILHSKEALIEINKLYGVNLDKKAEIIFHGNYDGCYPERASLGIKNENIVLLFFGGLKPYKGIECLISAFNQNKNQHLKLVIAGEPHTIEYQEKIQALSSGNINILTHFKFLNDQELSDYLAMSNAIVLPFADTLTSGSAILSMTYGKALILSDAARVFGCVPDDGAAYFRDTGELTRLLEPLDHSKLKNMGQTNLEKANKMKWSDVGKLTTNAYLNLVE